jgi:hypothetical protein
MLVMADLSNQGDFPKSGGTRWYEPLQEEPALFRKFADMPEGSEYILRFANEYGNLGEFKRELGPGETSSGKRIVNAEPLIGWVGMIRSMRQAVSLWDLAMDDDTKALEERIFWEENLLVYRPPFRWMLLGAYQDTWNSWIGPGPPYPIDHVELFEDHYVLRNSEYDQSQSVRLFGDIVSAALFAVQRIINPWLTGEPDRRGPFLRLDMEIESRRPRLRHWPSNLATALWLQFATAVSENRRYHQCKECGEWFEVPRRGGRISREYCSNSCRTTAYRKRQEKARQLHEDGKQLNEIARELGTDVKTIRGWISK